ncbi:hypothetical protein BCR39DRAFT_229288 [Naematelia encephala]|uniref:F-box domain-containing protein n=1 Tax=Naematelia encephala TaxID=71784 RepID=A0A1Y2AXP3_9TREE|nr:hypothetical protein BCR39DRAFT_229288 [Naematelia encephala]
MPEITVQTDETDDVEAADAALGVKPKRITRSVLRLSGVLPSPPVKPVNNAYLELGSDSDLTDLEDDPNHDALTFTETIMMAESSSDDSDYDQRRRSKGRRLSKIRGAKAINKGKGKARSKYHGEDEEADNEAETGGKKRKGKKDMVAEEAKWHDIPDWGDRKDCPLESLPPEVLNRCFGRSAGLELRDYVALAGVCRLFRSQFNNNFFWGVLGRRDWGVSTEETEKYALTPFTNTVEDWRRERSPPKPKPTHYIPRGDRKEWSESQYVVYREEKAFWRAAEKERRRKLHDEIEEGAERDRARARNRTRYIVVRESHRKILADVKGRLDGQTPVAKDERGLPVEVTYPLSTKVPALEEVNESTVTENLIAARTKRPSSPSNAIPGSHKKRRTTSPTRKKGWKVPETDTESEFEELTLYDADGAYIPFNHWRSEARRQAVETIHSEYINKTDALREFKVTEGELITLKHCLVTNPMSSKQPQQAFLRVAVEALAFRSHGGPLGQKEHIRLAEERASKLLKARQHRLEKKVALGKVGKVKAPCFHSTGDGWDHLIPPPGVNHSS